VSRITGNRQHLAAIACGVAALVVAAAGYFLVVAPQKTETADLQGEIASVQQKIDEYRSEARSPVEQLRFAELFGLTKAMPDQDDMPGVLLELSRVADEYGVVVQAVTPGVPVPLTGYTRLPIEVVVEGNFYDVSDFLFRLRTLVAVRDGKLTAKGRLFTVESLGFSEGLELFPELQAKLTVAAYVYGDSASTSAAPSPTPSPTPAPEQPSATEGNPTALGATG
jgi:type IV pilus assembly protein PilO